MLSSFRTLLERWRDRKSNSCDNFRGGKMSDESERDPELGEVLFEVRAIGNAVKVSALDPVTNTEVSIVGSAFASPYSLKVNALRKLKAALARIARQ